MRNMRDVLSDTGKHLNTFKAQKAFMEGISHELLRLVISLGSEVPKRNLRIHNKDYFRS